MRVILDTNVLQGALISPYGSPDRIYRACGLLRLTRCAYGILPWSPVMISEMAEASDVPMTIEPSAKHGLRIVLTASPV